MNQIRTNNDYRQYLIRNTNSIMTNNFQPVYQGSFEKKAYPYLFNGINDNNKPYGYETSLPKEMYLSQQQLDSSKVNPLQNNY
jgi:hypothetical protein